MLKKQQELSLFSAVLINLNIIIGSGIFINTTELAKRAGILGSFSYALVGVLLLPLILSFVKLLQLHPSGGFYSFCGTSLHPIVGFFNAWCYFAAKISSASLVIHVFVLFMQKTVPMLSLYDPLTLDICILAILLGLNLFNAKTGSTIQGWLMILKLFPIFFVIISGIFFLQGTNCGAAHQLWSGIPATIPLVLHAMLGFEAACAISRNIKNPQINAPRAVLISYGLVIILYGLYQTIFYAVLGSELAAQLDYRTAFPLLISKFTTNPYAQMAGDHLINAAIATSALGAGFGMIYANTWNLYSIAERRLTFFPHIITKLNRYNAPFVCVLAQGALAIFYMFIIQGEKVTFQQLSALASTVTYSLSILGLLATLIAKKQSFWLPILGLINCALLLSGCVYSIWWSQNPAPLYIFAFVATAGIGMYCLSAHTND